MDILQEIDLYVKQGRAKKVADLVRMALGDGVDAQIILDKGLLCTMITVGEKFRDSVMFVPEVLVVARAVNAGIEAIKESTVGSCIRCNGKVILGTVRGDLHDIGKNLVKTMMEGKGIQVIDLGVDVPPEKFVDEAIEQKAKIIACSALLTMTIGVLRDVVICANQRRVHGKIKIMVGGGPVTQSFCEKIGADYFAPDAATASDIAFEICSQYI